MPGGNDRIQRIFTLILTDRFGPTLMTAQRLPFDQVKDVFRNKREGVIKPLITF